MLREFRWLLLYMVIWAILFVQYSSVYAQGLSAKPIAGSGQYGVSIASATTLTVPKGANYAAICVQGDGNYTTDGTTPTSSIGIPISSTCIPVYGYATLKAFQVIASTGSPTMSVQYFSE